MSEKSVEKNYLYNLIYQLLLAIVPLITTPYVSIALTAEGVGVFSYTTAMTSYFTLFGNLGIAIYGQLKVAACRTDKEKVSKLFFELIILRAILMFIMIVVYLFFIFFVSSESNRLIYIVLIVQILASLFDISWFLQGVEEFKKLVIRNTVIKLINVVFIFLLIKKPSDLYLYAFIMNGSNLLGNLSIWMSLPRYISKIGLKELHPFRHLLPNIRYFIPAVATAIYLTMDKTILGWFTTNSLENGFYEQAHKIEQMALTVVTSLSIVTMPRMAYLYQNCRISEMKERLKNSVSFILMISIPMCFGLSAVSDSFIPLYLGKGYEKSTILLKIFSLLLIIVGLNNAIGKQVLMPTGRQKEYNRSVIIGACVNMTLNFVLIPRFFSIGATVSSIISEAVILIIFLLESKDYIKGTWILKRSAKYILGSFCMYLVLRFSSPFFAVNWFDLFLQILIGVTVYFVIILLIRDDYAISKLSRFYSQIIRKKHNNA